MPKEWPGSKPGNREVGRTFLSALAASGRTFLSALAASGRTFLSALAASGRTGMSAPPNGYLIGPRVEPCRKNGLVQSRVTGKWGGHSCPPWLRAGGHSCPPWLRAGGHSCPPWLRAGGQECPPHQTVT